MNEHRKVEPLTEANYAKQITALDRDLRLAVALNEQAQLDLLNAAATQRRCDIDRQHFMMSHR